MSHDDKLIGCDWTRDNRRGKRRYTKCFIVFSVYSGASFPSWYWECLLVWLNITNLHVVCVCRGTLSLLADIYWSMNCRVCVFGRGGEKMHVWSGEREWRKDISGISVSLPCPYILCTSNICVLLVFFLESFGSFFSSSPSQTSKAAFFHPPSSSTVFLSSFLVILESD